MQSKILNSNKILNNIQPIYNSGVSSPNLIYHNNSLIFSVGNNVVIDSI